MLKFLSLNTLLSAILGKDGLGGLVNALFAQFGLTDIMGLAVTYARGIYATQGHSAVVSMVTIKESSLRQWAAQTNADPDGVVAAGKAFANAFADFVGSFLPKQKTALLS